MACLRAAILAAAACTLCVASATPQPLVHTNDDDSSGAVTAPIPGPSVDKAADAVTTLLASYTASSRPVRRIAHAAHARAVHALHSLALSKRRDLELWGVPPHQGTYSDHDFALPDFAGAGAAPSDEATGTAAFAAAVATRTVRVHRLDEWVDWAGLSSLAQEHNTSAWQDPGVGEGDAARSDDSLFYSDLAWAILSDTAELSRDSSEMLKRALGNEEPSPKDKAVVVLCGSVRADPTDVDAWVELATALLSSGRAELAVAVAMRALEVHSSPLALRAHAVASRALWDAAQDAARAKVSSGTGAGATTSSDGIAPGATVSADTAAGGDASHAFNPADGWVDDADRPAVVVHTVMPLPDVQRAATRQPSWHADIDADADGAGDTTHDGAAFGDDCDVDRVDGSYITPEVFARDYISAGRPALISGLTHDWAAHVWTHTVAAGCEGHGGRLRQLAGETLAQMLVRCSFAAARDAVEAHGPAHEEVNKYLSLDTMLPDVAAGIVGAYTPPPLFGDDLLQPMCDPSLPDKWLLVAAAGGGSPWHVDPLNTSAWNALLAGRKLWALHPPSVRAPRGMESVTLAAGSAVLDDRFSCVEGCDAAWGVTGASRGVGVLATPLHYFRDVLPGLPTEDRPSVCVQRPNETMYVPPGWWHTVLNVRDSVAVTQNLLTATEGAVQQTVAELAAMLDSAPRAGDADGVGFDTDFLAVDVPLGGDSGARGGGSSGDASEAPAPRHRPRECLERMATASPFPAARVAAAEALVRRMLPVPVEPGVDLQESLQRDRRTSAHDARRRAAQRDGDEL